mmetsp:Transcript_22479/g.53350  ORF Transcript_22479/g.53350 Transcript_22479/m.53350 type:complete len:306 (-) Transcript_22479:641-1558(-)
MPSYLSDIEASPSVTVASDCVSPRVKSAEPCTILGRQAMRMSMARTSVVPRPSCRVPVSATTSRSAMHAARLSSLRTSAMSNCWLAAGAAAAAAAAASSSVAPPAFSSRPSMIVSSPSRGSLPPPVSWAMTAFCTALTAASRSGLSVFLAPSTPPKPHSATLSCSVTLSRANSSRIAGGFSRMPAVHLGLPTAPAQSVSARAIVRTAAKPSSRPSRTVSSGRKSAKPSIMSTASAVPARTRSKLEAAACSLVGLTTKVPGPSSPSAGGTRPTRTQATGLSKGTSESMSEAEAAVTPITSGMCSPS